MKLPYEPCMASVDICNGIPYECDGDDAQCLLKKGHEGKHKAIIPGTVTLNPKEPPEKWKEITVDIYITWEEKPSEVNKSGDA